MGTLIDQWYLNTLWWLYFIVLDVFVPFYLEDIEGKVINNIYSKFYN